MSAAIDSGQVRAYLLQLQQRIVAELERLDGGEFGEDRWDKPAGAALSGLGVTRILEDGRLFERAGVAFSQVAGNQLPASASANRPQLRSEEHTSELQSQSNLVCRLLLEKKK